MRDQTIDLDCWLEDADGNTIIQSGPPVDPKKDQTIERLKATIDAGTYYIRVEAMEDGQTGDAAGGMEDEATTTSVVYVVDDSASMDADFREVRTALKAVRDETMANTKVALIAFGTKFKVLFGLTDYLSAPGTTTSTRSAPSCTLLSTASRFG